MKNGIRYCPSCGRKTKTNNKHPKNGCPNCGASMIVVHPKVMEQIDINHNNEVSAPLGKMLKKKK